MIGAPEPEEVLDGLGDKVVGGLSRAVVLGRADLEEYRLAHPSWARAHTARGLANWIHDRIWDHLLTQLADVDTVTIVDEEPLRELYVGVTYRLRVKRHHLDGAVSSYPTLAALEFFGQQLPLPTLEEVRLIAGYEWDSEERAMGGPVLSLRDGKDDIVWQVPLPETGEGGGVRRPVRPEPTDPTVTLPGVEIRRTGAEGTSE